MKDSRKRSANRRSSARRARRITIGQCLWHRLLGRPASESAAYVAGTGATTSSDRMRRLRPRRGAVKSAEAEALTKGRFRSRLREPVPSRGVSGAKFHDYEEEEVGPGGLDLIPHNCRSSSVYVGWRRDARERSGPLPP
jgi:hypothetical protein